MTREEFSDLALSYLEEIAAFARRLTGNTADADDLVQATFERAFSISHAERCVPVGIMIKSLIKHATNEIPRSRINALKRF